MMEAPAVHGVTGRLEDKPIHPEEPQSRMSRRWQKGLLDFLKDGEGFERGAVGRQAGESGKRDQAGMGLAQEPQRRCDGNVSMPDLVAKPEGAGAGGTVSL